MLCSDGWLAVDPQLIRLAAPRCHVGPFERDASGPPLLEIRRSTQPLKGAVPFDGSPAPWGFFLLEPEVLWCHIPDDPYAAESVLRIAWQVATWRQGGFLAHGCGLRFGDRSVAAIGVSGAGKSTLAALASGPPANAKLLSDEIVQLFPDGRCFGTPFRSNVENVGSHDGAPLATLLVLEKGNHEQVTNVEPASVFAELAGNLYRSAVAEVSPRGLVQRLLALVERVGVRRLTFRKDAAVGPFLAEWVSRHAG